ncbi:MAG: hypothetical protein RRY95_05185 [Oscillospiraceae bacterium]
MTGELIAYGGGVYPMPTLLSWTLTYTGGVPCDSFSVTCLYDKKWEAVLPKLYRFRAVSGGRTQFFGVVDEYTVTQDGNGCLLEVTGRGLAALLLDNESAAVSYQRATTAEILHQHVEPYGIRCGASTALAGVYDVTSGSSQWKALAGFTADYGGFSPRFTREGTLLLTKGGDGERFLLTDKVPLLFLRTREKRYGVLSEVVVQDKLRHTTLTVKNEEFCHRGGLCRRVIYVPGQSRRNSLRYTGDYQIAQSRLEQVQAELTLQGAPPVFPGERVAIRRRELSGDYQVCETVWSGSGAGETTSLTLGKS